MKTIRIACDVRDHLPLEDLEPFQGSLKSLSKEDYARLRGEILDTGFAFPVHVWRSPEGKNCIVGGHQRVRTLLELRKAEGYAIPPVPVVMVLADSFEQAKRRVLQDISQYGVVEKQGLYEFLPDAALSLVDLDEHFRLPDVDIGSFGDEFFKDTSENEETDLYTKKIQAPVYEPKMDKPPPVASLVDLSKSETLTEEIRSADIPEGVKTFLWHAAARHAIFNYENIAEFYAHAPKKIQELMERSALVIIDFDKAIENGFVALSEELATTYKNDQ